MESFGNKYSSVDLLPYNLMNKGGLYLKNKFN